MMISLNEVGLKICVRFKTDAVTDWDGRTDGLNDLYKNLVLLPNYVCYVFIEVFIYIYYLTFFDHKYSSFIRFIKIFFLFQNADINKNNNSKKIKMARLKIDFQNDLYDLLKIENIPTEYKYEKTDISPSFEFIPKSDKQYVPNIKIKKRVKTVADIRREYEKYVCDYIYTDLDALKNTLYKRIRNGSRNNNDIVKLCENILKSDEPLSRTIWQILTNLNPKKYKYSTQYIMYKGQKVRICGSIGGNKEYLTYSRTVTSDHQDFSNKMYNKQKIKRNMLRSSLSIRFKPGPLSRKIQLDESYQKNYMGHVQLQKLPDIILEVNPTYGINAEPVMSKYLGTLRDERGVLSSNWIEFAVSAIGILKQNQPVQSNMDSIMFKTKYKNDQNCLLMRPDKYVYEKGSKLKVTLNSKKKYRGDIERDVEKVMHDMLNTVEISINQNDMFSNINEQHEIDETLAKLDNFGSNNKNKIERNCKEAFCQLGCICASLYYVHNNKSHCGQVNCMFNCKCGFSRIFSNEVKSEDPSHDKFAINTRRSIKTIANVKVENYKKNVFVKLENLICKNVQVWCMTHELYNCFCKGRILQPLPLGNIEVNVVDVDSDIAEKSSPEIKPSLNNEQLLPLSNTVKSSFLGDLGSINSEFNSELTEISCSRIKPYSNRKYNDNYYTSRNNTLRDIERNKDKEKNNMVNHKKRPNDSTNSIQPNKKLACATAEGKDYASMDIGGDNSTTHDFTNDSTEDDVINLTEVSDSEDEIICDSKIKENNTAEEPSSDLIKVNNFKEWLTHSYSKYKYQVMNGTYSYSLQAPRVNVRALYPRCVILSRFQEGKNYFLIEENPPHCLYITVNQRYRNCIDIRDIRFIDIENYPEIVKSILTSAAEPNFYVLQGLKDSWKIVAYVSKNKINESSNGVDVCDDNYDDTVMLLPDIVHTEMTQPDVKQPAVAHTDVTHVTVKQPDITHVKDGQPNITHADVTHVKDKQPDITHADVTHSKDKQPDVTHADVTQAEALDTTCVSKWFLLTMEDDFQELRFYNKGFFVKRNIISEAIEVARVKKKTVRLSAQICNEDDNPVQFGIYAIPYKNISCLFVGPYEKDDELGIETVKTSYCNSDKSTRGTWITTKKVDNIKVFDDPMFFLNQINFCNISNVLNVSNISTLVKKTEQVSLKEKEKVKPIKIRKSDGFYSLSTNQSLEAQITSPSANTNKVVVIERKNSFETKIIKMCDSNKSKTNSNKVGKKMSILKPEEINKKHIDIVDDNPPPLIQSEPNTYVNSEAVITGFDNVEISDIYTEIWIKCSNIQNLGHLQGRQNENKEISFKFPGFKFTDYYPDYEAYNKINE